MSCMRVLLIDDERRARERLARLLSAFPEIEIAGEAGDGIAAIELIAALQPDVVFLDVQMPGLNGFEVLAELPAANRPLIVFVTAWDRYALQAFDVSAVDYLVKPVEEDKLARAIARLRERAPGDPLAKLTAAVARPLRRIVGKRLQKLHVLPLETIEAFIAEGELVFALTADGRFLVERTLRDLEAALDADRFARVHKQTIVNLEKLAVLEPIPKGGATARMQSGAIVEISRRYATPLRTRLGW